MDRVRTYERGRGLAPFEVYRDHTAYEGRGTYRVVLAGKRIGAQISYPSADNCEAMLRQHAIDISAGQSIEAARRLEQARIGQARGARTRQLTARRRDTEVA